MLHLSPLSPWLYIPGCLLVLIGLVRMVKAILWLIKAVRLIRQIQRSAKEWTKEVLSKIPEMRQLVPELRTIAKGKDSEPMEKLITFLIRLRPWFATISQWSRGSEKVSACSLLKQKETLGYHLWKIPFFGSGELVNVFLTSLTLKMIYQISNGLLPFYDLCPGKDRINGAVNGREISATTIFIPTDRETYGYGSVALFQNGYYGEEHKGDGNAWAQATMDRCLRCLEEMLAVLERRKPSKQEGRNEGGATSTTRNLGAAPLT